MMIRFLSGKVGAPRDYKGARRHKYANKKTYVVLAFFIIFVLISLTMPSVIRTPLELIGAPLWDIDRKIRISDPVSSIFSYFKSRNALMTRIKELENQLLITRALDMEREALKEENNLLNQILGRSDADRKYVFGYVISRPNNTLYDTFILDIGLSHGVHVGDLVMYSGEYIVGEIVRAGEKNSLARLFSSPGVSSNVVIGGLLASTATGVGGGNFAITLPRDITIEVGMSVRLEREPKTIIGYVGSIERRSSDSFQRVLISSSINIFSTEGFLIYHP